MNIVCIGIDSVDDSFQCTLTTEHTASSYGIPVIVRGESLVDYGEVQTLWLVADADTQQPVHSRTHSNLDALLSPYGVKVRRFAP